MNGLGGSELRDLLLTAEEEVKRAWDAAPREGASENPSFDTAAQTVLDRVTQVGVSLIENRQLEDVAMVVDTLIHLFRAAGEQRPPTLAVVPLADDRQALRWYDITTRVYVLGAISVSVKAFSAIPQLVLQQPNEMRKGRFWLRDTVTALARLKRFEKNSLIGPISEYVAERPVFYRRFRNNKDAVVANLCQFDFLQCVISVVEAGDLIACYPNFGGFYKERTEPVVVDLVSGGKSREALPGIDDETLAKIMVDLDRLADREFFSYAAWDGGHWSDKRVTEFLARYAGRDRA
jgi:hypothetical protein